MENLDGDGFEFLVIPPVPLQALQRHPDIHVGEVDCVANQELCRRHGVTGYPAIRWGSSGTVMMSVTT